MHPKNTILGHSRVQNQPVWVQYAPKIFFNKLSAF